MQTYYSGVLQSRNFSLQCTFVPQRQQLLLSNALTLKHLKFQSLDMFRSSAYCQQYKITNHTNFVKRKVLFKQTNKNMIDFRSRKLG